MFRTHVGAAAAIAAVWGARCAFASVIPPGAPSILRGAGVAASVLGAGVPAGATGGTLTLDEEGDGDDGGSESGESVCGDSDGSSSEDMSDSASAETDLGEDFEWDDTLSPAPTGRYARDGLMRQLLLVHTSPKPTPVGETEPPRTLFTANDLAALATSLQKDSARGVKALAFLCDPTWAYLSPLSAASGNAVAVTRSAQLLGAVTCQCVEAGVDSDILYGCVTGPQLQRVVDLVHRIRSVAAFPSCNYHAAAVPQPSAVAAASTHPLSVESTFFWPSKPTVLPTHLAETAWVRLAHFQAGIAVSVFLGFPFSVAWGSTWRPKVPVDIKDSLPQLVTTATQLAEVSVRVPGAVHTAVGSGRGFQATAATVRHATDSFLVHEGSRFLAVLCGLMAQDARVAPHLSTAASPIPSILLALDSYGHKAAINTTVCVGGDVDVAPLYGLEALGEEHLHHLSTHLHRSYNTTSPEAVMGAMVSEAIGVGADVTRVVGLGFSQYVQLAPRIPGFLAPNQATDEREKHAAALAHWQRVEIERDSATPSDIEALGPAVRTVSAYVQGTSFIPPGSQPIVFRVFADARTNNTTVRYPTPVASRSRRATGGPHVPAVFVDADTVASCYITPRGERNGMVDRKQGYNVKMKDLSRSSPVVKITSKEASQIAGLGTATSCRRQLSAVIDYVTDAGPAQCNAVQACAAPDRHEIAVQIIGLKVGEPLCVDDFEHIAKMCLRLMERQPTATATSISHVTSNFWARQQLMAFALEALQPIALSVPEESWGERSHLAYALSRLGLRKMGLCFNGNKRASPMFVSPHVDALEKEGDRFCCAFPAHVLTTLYGSTIASELAAGAAELVAAIAIRRSHPSPHPAVDIAAAQASRASIGVNALAHILSSAHAQRASVRDAAHLPPPNRDASAHTVQVDAVGIDGVRAEEDDPDGGSSDEEGGGGDGETSDEDGQVSDSAGGVLHEDTSRWPTQPNNAVPSGNGDPDAAGHDALLHLEAAAVPAWAGMSLVVAALCHPSAHDFRQLLVGLPGGHRAVPAANACMALFWWALDHPQSSLPTRAFAVHACASVELTASWAALAQLIPILPRHAEVGVTSESVAVDGLGRAGVMWGLRTPTSGSTTSAHLSVVCGDASGANHFDLVGFAMATTGDGHRAAIATCRQGNVAVEWSHGGAGVSPFGNTRALLDDCTLGTMSECLASHLCERVVASLYVRIVTVPVLALHELAHSPAPIYDPRLPGLDTRPTALKPFVMRPAQNIVVSHLLSRPQDDVLVSLETGGGKSAIFQLCALASPGVTVALYPLVALLRDQFQRGKGVTVASEPYPISVSLHSNGSQDMSGLDTILSSVAAIVSPDVSQPAPLPVKLVFATIDMVISACVSHMRHPHGGGNELFCALANLYRMRSLDGHRMLSRFVFDEVHTLSTYKFKACMAMAWVIRVCFPETPFVMCSATLPSAIAREVLSMCGARNTVVFATATARSNLRFSRLQQATGSLTGTFGKKSTAAATEAALALVPYLSAVVAQGGKGILYCGTRKATEAVTSALHGKLGLSVVSAFHSKRKDKEVVMEHFCGGRTQLLCGTSACGVGLDVPDIRAVVFLAPPLSASSFAQESGRAGRDGRYADVLLVHTINSDVFIKALTGRSLCRRPATLALNQDHVFGLLATASSCVHGMLLEATGTPQAWCNLDTCDSAAPVGTSYSAATPYCCNPPTITCRPMSSRADSSTVTIDAFLAGKTLASERVRLSLRMTDMERRNTDVSQTSVMSLFRPSNHTLHASAMPSSRHRQIVCNCEDECVCAHGSLPAVLSSAPFHALPLGSQADHSSRVRRRVDAGEDGMVVSTPVPKRARLSEMPLAAYPTQSVWYMHLILGARQLSSQFDNDALRRLLAVEDWSGIVREMYEAYSGDFSRRGITCVDGSYLDNITQEFLLGVPSTAADDATAMLGRGVAQERHGVCTVHASVRQWVEVISNVLIAIDAGDAVPDMATTRATYMAL